MKEYEIDGIVVSSEIEGFRYEDAEYVVEELKKGEILQIANVHVELEPESGMWSVNYDLKQPKFERIRRITGYLTGTLDTWNNAKRAEESERVKHGVS